MRLNTPLPTVYGTQGGGYVAYCNLQRRYLFVEPPDWDASLKEGDPMPDEWGIAGPVKDRDLEIKAAGLVQEKSLTIGFRKRFSL